MLPLKTRQAILALSEKGLSIRKISTTLKVSRKAIRRVLRKTQPTQSSNPQPIISLLPELFSKCQGNAVRIREELKSEHDIDIAYSTLTRLLRSQQLRAPKQRSGRYRFEPGEEMQHDTSPHRLTIAGKTVTAQCAALVLGYSRLVFARYYPGFTRFEAKCFLTDAIRFFDGAAKRCTIDNTSVLVASGSGPEAIIAPEMEAFGQFFGTRFVPHAIGHADRKAYVERLFSYIEHNFLAGRSFESWPDLNAQLLGWCESTANAKPKRSLGMSPQAAFVMEKPLLHPLPAYIPPVYQTVHRVVDTQGYIHLDRNRYSVPERLLCKKVEVHKQYDTVQVFFDRRLVAEHPRLIGMRDGESLIDEHHSIPRRRKAGSGPSPYERDLVGRDPILDRYVEALKQRSPGRSVVKLRRLLQLQRRYPTKPFLAAIGLALHYRLFDLARLERLILQRVAGDFFDFDGDA
jgi:transposase